MIKLDDFLDNERYTDSNNSSGINSKLSGIIHALEKRAMLGETAAILVLVSSFRKLRDGSIDLLKKCNRSSRHHGELDGEATRIYEEILAEALNDFIEW